MTGFLVGSLVVIAADDGPAIAAAGLVAVPEYLHQVAWQGALPDVESAPFTIGQVALIGRLAVAHALGPAIGRETVAGTQFAHQHAQSGSIGVGTPPEAHAIVLSHPLGVELIGDAHAGLHVDPRLALDLAPGVPDEQRLDEHAIGGAGTEGRLGQHRVKSGPLVVHAHLKGIVQATPGGPGKQLVGPAARVVTAMLGK